jgi:hypothetical protein
LSIVTRHSSPASTARRTAATAVGSVSGVCRNRQFAAQQLALRQPGEPLEGRVDVHQRLVGQPDVDDRHTAGGGRQRAVHQGVAGRADQHPHVEPVGRGQGRDGRRGRDDRLGWGQWVLTRRDPRQQRRGRPDDGVAVVGEGVGEPALGVGAVVPEVAGQQRGGEVRAEHGDVPLAADRVRRVEGGDG